jgi:hypothetical protein
LQQILGLPAIAGQQVRAAQQRWRDPSREHPEGIAIITRSSVRADHNL